MADNFQSHKVAANEQSSSTKFNNFVQAVQDAINSLDDSNIASAAAILVAKLASGSNGDVLTTVSGIPTWTPPASSGATVATTIAGLGTASDGKIGLIRAGSSPFTLLPVVYDATYAKWVSADTFTYEAGTRSTGQGAIGSSYVDEDNLFQIPNWRALDTAGLKPQFRLHGRFQAGSAGTVFVRLAYSTADAGAAFATDVAITSTELSTTSTGSQVAVDSGYGDLVAGWTIKDQMLVHSEVKTSGSISMNWNGYVSVRWVSQ